MDRQEPVEAEPDPRSAKRRKIQVACQPCRDRKTRCDGVHPVCSTCKRRGKAGACTYDQDEIPTLQHLRYVEGRLKQLEARSHEQSSQFSPVPGTTQIVPKITTSLCAYNRGAFDTEKSLPTAVNDLRAGDHVRFDASSGNFVGSISSTSLSHSPQSARDTQTLGDPGIPHQQAAVRTNEPTSLSSSNLGFLRSLDTSWSMPGEGRGDKHRLSSLPKLLWKRLDKFTMIPPRPVADSLLELFFTFAHEFLPVFHRLEFNKQYEKLWTPSKLAGPDEPHARFEDNIFLATLNVCFALGSLFSEPVPGEDRESTSDEYYERSRMLINFDICDYSALSTVKLQLVTGLYLQTTPNASRCWNVVGMAIRLAQDLGLHKDPSKNVQSGHLEVELKRRVWHSCVVMDVLLASIYGRPPMVSRHCDVQLPSDVDHEYTTVDSSGTISSALIPGPSVFRLSVQLLGILHEILEKIYPSSPLQLADRSRSRDTELLRQSLELNDQLDTFLASMPDSLRSFLAAEPSENCSRACNLSLHEQALVTRFLYARIMLLRPLTLVTRNKNRSSSLNLGSTVLRECCSLCLLSAELLVLSLRQEESTSRRLADWHAIYLMFTAATVFLAVGRLPILQGNDLPRRFQVFRRHCVEILHSTTVRNTLTAQLESLLSFLQNVMFRDEEQDSDHNVPTSTSSITAEPSITTSLDDITPASVAITDAWSTFDLDQMLEQQFLDPSWLEDIRV